MSSVDIVIMKLDTREYYVKHNGIEYYFELHSDMDEVTFNELDNNYYKLYKSYNINDLTVSLVNSAIEKGDYESDITLDISKEITSRVRKRLRELKIDNFLT